MPVTNTNVELHLFVDDIAGTIALYDKIQVFRSTGTSSGPWEEVAGTSAKASITGWSKTEPFALHGKTLELTIGTSVVTASFPGADPYTAAAAVVNINTALGVLGLATVTADGRIKIETAATGTAAGITATGGTGYANAGFQLNDFGIGVDAWVTLVVGQKDYYYTDHNGSSLYWYRYRFYNTVSGAYSEYSYPVPGNSIRKLSATDLITGTIHLVDLVGFALENKTVVLTTTYDPAFSGIYGVLGVTLYLTTDENGYAFTSLVKNSLIELIIVETGVRRRIRVPSTGTSFDLLDPSLSDDEFGIQYHSVSICERKFP